MQMFPMDSEGQLFGDPSEVSGYTDVSYGLNTIFFTGGEKGAEGVFEVPVTARDSALVNELDPFVIFEILDIQPTQPAFPLLEGSGGQCNSSSSFSNNGPTTVYYSIHGGATQSFEATCS